MTDISERCSKRVYGGSITGHPCSNKGVLEYDGRRYCKLHFPPNVKAKDKARNDKWEREWAEKSKLREDSAKRQLELERKAAAYDRLVKWLDSGAAGTGGIRKILEGEEQG